MSKDVNFAKLDKDFAYIKDGTTLIQRTILSMACHFPDGMRYDNIALGKIFQVSDNRISHLVNDLDKKGFTKILLPRSKYRIIYLNPDNSTLVKIAKYHEDDPDLHCSKQPSTKCLHCYFHKSTLVKTANSIKEVIKVKDNKGDSLDDSEKDLLKQPTESKSLFKSVASDVPPNGELVEAFIAAYPPPPVGRTFVPCKVRTVWAEQGLDSQATAIMAGLRKYINTLKDTSAIFNPENFLRDQVWEAKFGTKSKGWT